MNKEDCRIEPIAKSNYTIGAVNYEVTALFNEHGNTLKDTLQRVLMDEIRKNPIDTFASQQLNVVK